MKTIVKFIKVRNFGKKKEEQELKETIQDCPRVQNLAFAWEGCCGQLMCHRTSVDFTHGATRLLIALRTGWRGMEREGKCKRQGKGWAAVEETLAVVHRSRVKWLRNFVGKCRFSRSRR
jgi:hypothetical protein